MKEILLASGNKGKLVELKALFEDFPGGEVRFVTPSDLGIKLDVVEDGETYAENARLKAEAYCQASGMLTLADDSGLEVDALDGRPGLYSARYSGKPNATDADRRAYMLEELAGKSQPWLARFRCLVALAQPQSEVYFSEGVCEGQIIPSERGDHGFGYDPIFEPQAAIACGRTMAELTMVEKNQISHRALAVQSTFPFLKELFGE